MLSEPLDNHPGGRTVAPTPQLRAFGRLIAVASILVIGAATLTPHPGPAGTDPFCLICGPFGGVDAILNVVLFLPLGIGLALAGFRAVPSLLAIFFFSSGIEVAQYFVITGRDGNIGDVLTNVLGGSLGFALARRSDVWRRPSRRAALALCACWSVVWLSIQLLSSYAFTPALPASHYYGQIARTFGQMATFRGGVTNATIDTVTVPDFGYAKTRQFHESLERGNTVRAVVIPAGPTDLIAPIIRVADESQREIVILGQDHTDLVFGIRTGASTLRLRPARFGFRGVFPSGADHGAPVLADTLDLRARYRATNVEMQVDSRGKSRRVKVAIYPALGWIFLLPMQWQVEGTPAELVFGFIWMAALLIPLGCWAFFVAASEKTAPGWSFALLGVVAVVLGVGIILVPRTLGLGAPTLGAFLATALGLLLGISLARTQQTTAC
jgi:hypothetical protein